MKKIKLLVMVLMLFISMAMIINVNATEVPTEEPTAEEVSAEEEVTLPPLDNQLFADAKDWITAAIAAIVSWLFGGGAVYLILKRYERRAFKEIEKAVAANEMSQKQADLATHTIAAGTTKFITILQNFENKVTDKVDVISEQSESLSGKMDKINNVIDVFGEAINEYLIEDEEV